MISTATVKTWADTEPEGRAKAHALLAAYFGTDAFAITSLDATALMEMAGTVATWEIRADGELRTENP